MFLSADSQLLCSVQSLQDSDFHRLHLHLSLIHILRLESVVVSCQHGAEKNLKKLDAEIREKVLRSALRLLPPDEDTKILINPSGKFVCGGFDADTGLTGRKLMVDTYGSRCV